MIVNQNIRIYQLLIDGTFSNSLKARTHQQLNIITTQLLSQIIYLKKKGGGGRLSPTVVSP